MMNRVNDAIRIREHVRVPESNYTAAMPLQIMGPCFITAFVIQVPMKGAIYFHNQPRLGQEKSA
jgi:hypothetical protein